MINKTVSPMGKSRLWNTELRTVVRILNENPTNKTKEERRITIWKIIEQTNVWDKIYLDPLTWLYNRKALEEIKQFDNQNSTIMIDVNKFKEINDVHWHLSWDLALQKIWEIIHASIRTNVWDKAFRYWWDEFLILLWEWNIDPNKIVSRIENKINKMDLFIDWKKMDISLSFWTHKKDTLNLDSAIEKADKQLSNNKNGEWDFYRTKRKIEDIKSPNKTKELVNIGLGKLNEEEKVGILKDIIESLESPELLKIIKGTTEEVLIKIKEAV